MDPVADRRSGLDLYARAGASEARQLCALLRDQISRNPHGDGVSAATTSVSASVDEVSHTVESSTTEMPDETGDPRLVTHKHDRQISYSCMHAYYACMQASQITIFVCSVSYERSRASALLTRSPDRDFVLITKTSGHETSLVIRRIGPLVKR